MVVRPNRYLGEEPSSEIFWLSHVPMTSKIVQAQIAIDMVAAFAMTSCRG
jgi:hypothetical protein